MAGDFVELYDVVNAFGFVVAQGKTKEVADEIVSVLGNLKAYPTEKDMAH